MRSRSESSGKLSEASDAPRAFEMTAGLLKAKRVKDRAFAKEAYVGAAWILGPGPAALAAVILILANEIVFHTSSTECVAPLDSERARRSGQRPAVSPALLARPTPH